MHRNAVCIFALLVFDHGRGQVNDVRPISQSIASPYEGAERFAGCRQDLSTAVIEMLRSGNQETAQYTVYRRSKRLLSGTSVTFFLCPVVRKVSGESAGLIHEFGSREP